MKEYLTAEKLNMSEDEYQALLAVKEFLGTIPIVQNPKSEFDHTFTELREPHDSRFCMAYPVKVYDCGTAGCIGGWMGLFMRGITLDRTVEIPDSVARSVESYVYNSEGELHRLFFPKQEGNGPGQDYSSITPERAAQEIETFLTTGKVTW